MTIFPISNRTRILEISAVILTAIGKFIFMDYLHWRLAFITVSITCWIIYVYSRNKAQPNILKYWGFKTDNFKKVALTILPFGLATVLVCIGIGIYMGSVNITWHIIPILILYPIWGTIQQFLLIALTAGNLQDFQGINMSKMVIVFVTALLFGLIHYPYLWLMIGTFILAIFYGLVYLKNRNIYVLGLFHGWLGAILFYTVVGRDPFVETFGRLFHISK